MPFIECGKLAAFARRDWQVRTSYRLGLLTTFGQVIFTAATFYFIGRLIDGQSSAWLEPYGGSYFSFALLGIALSQYLNTSLSSFSGTLRDEQLQGTLETVLASPTKLSTVAIGGVLWDFLWATADVAVYLIIGVGLFGLDIGRMNVPASLVLILLSIACLASIGIFSACGVLLWKEGDPVAWVSGGAMKLLSGVYFPVALLPLPLRWLAQCSPLTYVLEGIRQAVLQGKSLGELWPIVLWLGLFSAGLWPLALAAFSLTIHRLKKNGALNFR